MLSDTELPLPVKLAFQESREIQNFPTMPHAPSLCCYRKKKTQCICIESFSERKLFSLQPRTELDLSFSSSISLDVMKKPDRN